ncbi:MAG: hypothetical protein AMQ22_02015 [Candidatus Methanofastidiosum methylothiophilum]|uniref:Uncharacterized protein n=1 Tax=Candidatus Methanofastidiosum methylothiophilum TaxID=1705564 RepID=A0A150IQ45_9EURY|nr:MAG: hypothetical protein AMQ22_02015 [Candidatus Methanofastidiosum methylthiophilus]
MHFNTKRFQIILFTKRFYINTEGFPRLGEYKKAVIKWGVGLGLIEIRRWGWIKRKSLDQTSMGK